MELPEGIVVRRIPKYTVSLYSAITYGRYHNKSNHRLIENHPVYKRDMVEVTDSNSLGGKYLVTFQQDQTATVRFNLMRCGVGSTIEEALEDWNRKHRGSTNE